MLHLIYGATIEFIPPDEEYVGARGYHHATTEIEPPPRTYPHAKILQFDGSGITEVAYEDTEHYFVTRDYLNNYPRRLEQLLADE